jgi:hypothetical protein
MPPRRLTKKVGQKHEMEAFAEKYDTLALIYGDPVEVVFSRTETCPAPFRMTTSHCARPTCC